MMEVLGFVFEKLQGFGHVIVCMKCDCFEGVTTSKRIKDKRKDEATLRESPPPREMRKNWRERF